MPDVGRCVPKTTRIADHDQHLTLLYRLLAEYYPSYMDRRT